MAEGGMARRLVAFANVLVGLTRLRGGLSAVNIIATTFLSRHLRLGGRGHLGDRLGDDPADGEERLSPRVRHQRDDHRLRAGAPGAAEPQCGDLFARDRRHHLRHQHSSWPAWCRACCSASPSSSYASHSPIRTSIRAARPCRSREAVRHLDRRALGPDHARRSSWAASWAASSPRSRRARSPACGPSSSPCSSTAITAGATCRS